MNLNRVVLIGRLCADPDQPQTQSDTVITRFRMAVNRRGKPREGQPEADFFNVACFRQTAEFAMQYLRKGYLVAVEGAVQLDEYTTRDGEKRAAMSVTADNVQNLTPRQDGGEDRQEAPRSQRREEPRDRRPSREETRRRDFDDDDAFTER